MSLDIVYAYMESHPDDPFGDTEEILSWANGELADIREQVKVLREALEVACKRCVELRVYCAFELDCEACPSHKALDQTKPKGEREVKL